MTQGYSEPKCYVDIHTWYAPVSVKSSILCLEHIRCQIKDNYENKKRWHKPWEEMCMGAFCSEDPNTKFLIRKIRNTYYFKQQAYLLLPLGVMSERWDCGEEMNLYFLGALSRLAGSSVIIQNYFLCSLTFKNPRQRAGVVAFIFNPCTLEILVSLTFAWSMQWVLAQPGLHTETLYQKQNEAQANQQVSFLVKHLESPVNHWELSFT